MSEPNVCGWAMQSDNERHYHDTEWGLPSTDDRHLFEMMVLESAQAGLSWRTVLNKRERYRHHYRNFDPNLVANFGETEISAMLADPGVIRNRRKIEASITNARVFLQIAREHGSFARWLWRWVDGKPIINRPASLADIPAETALSQALCKDLKKRGVRFFGPTIVYAYLQSCGLINDHLPTCPQFVVCCKSPIKL